MQNEHVLKKVEFWQTDPIPRVEGEGVCGKIFATMLLNFAIPF